MKNVPEKVKALLPPMILNELMSLPENGLAEIRPVNPKRTGNIMVRDYTDEMGNQRLFIDEHGAQRSFRYEKKVSLNFSKLRDCLEYLHVRDHLFTREGVANKIPILEVIDLNSQARKRIAKKDLESKANGKVCDLSGNALFDFARILLIKIVPGSGEDMVKDLIYKEVAKDPAGVLAEFESPDRYVKEVFFKALVKNIISDRMGTWFFQTEKIGVNQEQAIAWLKMNQDLIPRIVSLTSGEESAPITAAPSIKHPEANVQPPTVNKVSKEDEENFNEFKKMGDDAVEQKNYAEALECYQKCVEIKPQVPYIFKKIKEVKKALIELEESSESK